MAGPNIALCCFSVTLGAWLVISEMFVWLRASISSAVTAVMASVVSCRFCWRNCAVTTISSSTSASSAANVAVAEAAMHAATARRTALPEFMNIESPCLETAVGKNDRPARILAVAEMQRHKALMQQYAGISRMKYPTGLVAFLHDYCFRTAGRGIRHEP